ncbi:dynein light chain, putative [Plasmodium chabaudi chabaudi]|uniref:Dynein light chain, putative n=1 Tax=Plasmodium chabaudi chabaudi TaxID=31271 RepID=A0A1C6XA63_PLACU|nr:dynein light chain, putative [Plasmodium chabaudi chabaudi]
MKSQIINSLMTLFNNELKENLLKSRNKEEITNTVSNLIKNNIKAITSNRYKVVIEILLNENKGQGIKCVL